MKTLMFSLLILLLVNGCSKDDPVTPETPTMPTAGLILHYPLNGDGTEASGHATNGTVHNTAPTVNRHSKAASACSFNGNAYIEVPAAASLPTGNQPRTISAWFKTTVMANQVIVEWGTHAQGQRCGMLVCDLLGGVADFSGYINDFRGTKQVINNAWHHYVFTYDGTVGRIYLNGVLDAESTVVLNTQGTLFSIGRRANGNQTLEYFQGAIDDVRVYNRVLSMAEIQLLASE